MANGHGGARPGAGRKKKALSEKIIDGNPGKAPLTKLQFSVQDSALHGEDVPPVSEWLTQTTKNSQQNIAQQVYENTWKWLKDRGCDQYVKFFAEQRIVKCIVKIVKNASDLLRFKSAHLLVMNKSLRIKDLQKCTGYFGEFSPV